MHNPLIKTRKPFHKRRPFAGIAFQDDDGRSDVRHRDLYRNRCCSVMTISQSRSQGLRDWTIEIGKSQKWI